MNWREEVAWKNLRYIREHAEDGNLTDWEVDFLLSICEIRGEGELQKLTSRQFNKLHEIATDLRKRIAKETYGRPRMR